ncbi:putative ABC exporter domain-containing protein [Schlesneria sp. DSM 10557]|uniref:putative ABC exporter domain-containing protein n=1 Tax=Schlesneria sp. DSM 10557 TaxID=3044399 RepID=UPI0035A142FD
MFHPALWKLIRFQWRGNFRQFRKSLRTPRGIFQALFIFAMILYGLGSLYLATRFSAQSAPLAKVFGQLQDDFLPLGLFGYVCYALLFQTGESTVYYTPSEVAFLFPAPITRKQLLTYPLLKSHLGMVTISVMFALVSTPRLSMILPRAAALVMTLSFVQLLTINVAFTRQILKARINTIVRQVLGLVIGSLVLMGIMQTAGTAAEDLASFLTMFKESPAGSALLVPFQFFVGALRADDWPSFLFNAAIILLVDTALLVLVFRLDGLTLEAAMAFSEKMTQRMKALQSKGIWDAFSPTNSEVARRRLPPLPFWSGIGPILWQRMTTTIRSSASTLWILGGAVLFASGLVYLMATSNSPQTREFGAPAAGVGAMAYLSFLICLTLQHDIERVGYLKSLPIRSVSIVLGDLLGFPLIVSAVQIVFIGTLSCFFPAVATWLICGALVMVPMNFLLFAIDKLVFYVYPTRMSKGAPGDFQNSGKQIVFIALKMLMLGAALLLMGLVAIPGGVVFQSPVIAGISAAVALLIQCVAIVPLLVMAYKRFDPSTIIVQ